MGRGRGKGKKPSVVTVLEDPGIGEDEKLSANRRRGRLQNLLKDDSKEEMEAEKMEEDGDISNDSFSMKGWEDVASANGKKRKRSTQANDIVVTEKHEINIELMSSNKDSTKSVGFRQIGSRCKNTPRRAAEAGIICK